MIGTEQVTHYTDEFYNDQVDGSLASARIVAPIVQRLVGARSVVDFGCGRAPWLKAFREVGAETVLGLDGSYVDRNKLLIEGNEFRVNDLNRPESLDRTYDLAVCLEVVEHLSLSASHRLIQALTSAAPIVLFSAALPGQTGTHHINEQWPEYWEQAFADRNYQRLDLIRALIWRDTRVEMWYRQNIYLYVSAERCDAILAAMPEDWPSSQPDLELIDPRILAAYKTFPRLLAATLSAGKRSLALKLYRLLHKR